MPLTTKHLSITPGLQLLAHRAIDSKVSWRGYCNGTLYCLWPFFIQCFVLPTLTEVGFLNAMKLLKWSFLTVPCFFFSHRWTYLRGVIMVLITVASKYVLSIHVWDMFFKIFPLTPSFSRLLQACPGAVRKTVHDAQEHAKALREHRQLFLLWPPSSQRGGFFRRTGQLPHPLHGEYRVYAAVCMYMKSLVFTVSSK